jgi:hypothetical protein
MSVELVLAVWLTPFTAPAVSGAIAIQTNAIRSGRVGEGVDILLVGRSRLAEAAAGLRVRHEDSVARRERRPLLRSALEAAPASPSPCVLPQRDIVLR